MPSVSGTRETRQGIRFCGDGGVCGEGGEAKQTGKGQDRDGGVTICINALVPKQTAAEGRKSHTKEQGEKTCGA